MRRKVKVFHFFTFSHDKTKQNLKTQPFGRRCMASITTTPTPAIPASKVEEESPDTPVTIDPNNESLLLVVQKDALPSQQGVGSPRGENCCTGGLISLSSTPNPFSGIRKAPASGSRAPIWSRRPSTSVASKMRATCSKERFKEYNKG